MSEQPVHTIGRRPFLGVAGALLAAPAGRPGAAPFAIHERRVPGDKRIGQRFTLLLPRHNVKRPLGLLVALHGLGETHDQRIGARAWLDRYGLGHGYRRLLRPPVAALATGSRHWAKNALQQFNQSLQQHPFEGFAVVCPFTPNVYRLPRKKALDDYAAWLSDVVIPSARREANISSQRVHTHLTGCSLGGYIGMEVMLRKSTIFGAFSSIQGALGRHRLRGYQEKLSAEFKKGRGFDLLLATSNADPFLAVNRKLYRMLRKKGLKPELHVGKGPHNQPYLRDHGTVQMLRWHDRHMP